MPGIPLEAIRMPTLSNPLKKFCLAAMLGFMTLPTSGCSFFYWCVKDAWIAALHYGTTPLIR